MDFNVQWVRAHTHWRITTQNHSEIASQLRGVHTASQRRVNVHSACNRIGGVVYEHSEWFDARARGLVVLVVTTNLTKHHHRVTYQATDC